MAAERNRIASNWTDAEMKPETHTPAAISAHCAAGMRLSCVSVVRERPPHLS